MKLILILGAGKSSVYLIEYLAGEGKKYNWRIVVADSNIESARSRIPAGSDAEAAGLDVRMEEPRQKLIQTATLVISLLPPDLHYLVALDCLAFGKHLFTASYIDDQLEALRDEIKKKNLLFLCEIGLDPGIDHMSAMQMIDEIHNEGGKIISFRSHCGGLLAPESNDNPWHYKISWNPRNIVLAGNSGAIFREKGVVTEIPYEELFQPENTVDIPELGELCWYANRNSLRYIDKYGLASADTFIRTTLRYPEFCLGWKTVVALKLTDQTIFYDTDQMSLQTFYKQHFSQHGFAKWVEDNLIAGFRETTDMLERIEKLISLREDPEEDVNDDLRKFMLIDEKGALTSIGLDEIKAKAAYTVALKKHEAALILNQLLYLGMNDDITVINKGRCSAADVLQFALEKKLPLLPGDLDMVVMLHEIIYELDGKTHEVSASMLLKGKDHLHTAMAKTVGLPLGIAVSCFLKNEIPLEGLHIPISSSVYVPVLHALKEHGISFTENRRIL